MEEQQSTITSASASPHNNNNHNHNNKMMTRSSTETPPPTPPVIRPTIRLSSSFSPPPTPSQQTPNRQRQAAWWQSSVVRRSSSAVDEAVDELTEKSKFLLLRKRSSSTITNTTTTTPRSSSGSSSSVSDPPGSHQRLDRTTEEEEDAGCFVEREIATFHRDEIVTGELLGQGTFNCVYEVIGFELQSHDEDDDKDNPSNTSLLRKQIVNGVSQKQRSFALKHLKHELLDDTLQFEQAATDLVMEAKYLAALNHPNILQIHGEPALGTAAINNGVDGYFLLTDRLSETLAQRIERWSAAAASDAVDPTNTVVQKLRYGLQIADALRYLHQQRILFRDLKPSNIGFHQDDPNRIQLFDLGLVRELPPSCQARPYIHGATNADIAMDCSEYSLDMELEAGGIGGGQSWIDEDDEDNIMASPKDYEEVYHMSGAGTQIYMAPEILVQNRYNLKADVYSWSMVMSEMLLSEKPLPQYEEMDDHIQYVCVEGDRPTLHGEDCDPNITDSVRDLLAWAWEGNVLERCTVTQVCDELSDILRELDPEELQDQEEEDQQDHHRLVSSSLSLGLSSRFFQAARSFQQYLISVMGRTFQRVSSFLFRGRRHRRHRRRQDVTFDLPTQEEEEEDKKSPSSNATAEETEDLTETLVDPTTTSSAATPEDPAALLLPPPPPLPVSNSNASNEDCVLLSPRPADVAALAPPLLLHSQQQQQPPRSVGAFSHPKSSSSVASALLKRKPSSASTTATTDDEFDEDDLLSLGIPPTSPLYFKPPCMPLEALVERHCSNSSTATATTKIQ